MSFSRLYPPARRLDWFERRRLGARPRQRYGRHAAVWGQEDEPRGSCRLHQLGHLQASASRRDSFFPPGPFQQHPPPPGPGLHNLLFIKQKSAIPNPSASALLPEEGRILEAVDPGPGSCHQQDSAASRLVASLALASISGHMECSSCLFLAVATHSDRTGRDHHWTSSALIERPGAIHGKPEPRRPCCLDRTVPPDARPDRPRGPTWPLMNCTLPASARSVMGS